MAALPAVRAGEDRRTCIVPHGEPGPGGWHVLASAPAPVAGGMK
ncbi:hypothetical protein [Streptomyces anulatus]